MVISIIIDKYIIYFFFSDNEQSDFYDFMSKENLL